MAPGADPGTFGYQGLERREMRWSDPAESGGGHDDLRADRHFLVPQAQSHGTSGVLGAGIAPIDPEDGASGAGHELGPGFHRRLGERLIETAPGNGESPRQCKSGGSPGVADDEGIERDPAELLRQPPQSGRSQDVERLAIQAGAANLLPRENVAVDQEHARPGECQQPGRHRACRTRAEDDDVPRGPSRRSGEIARRHDHGRSHRSRNRCGQCRLTAAPLRPARRARPSTSGTR